MKKFLISLIAIFLAGLGLGGVSMADNVAKIGGGECGEPGTTCYDNLSDAIAAGGEIEIIKAGEYTLPTTITNDTIIEKADSVEGEVILKIDGTTILDGQALITLGGDFTIKGATVNLVNIGSNWEHLGDSTHKITMEKCIINGELYVRGDMDFKECTFNGQGKYQIHINYGNVNFDTCTFTNNVSRHINIAWGGDAVYKITFKDSTFTNTVGAASKAAVMIHELWNQTQYSATNNPSYYRGVSEDKLIDINGIKYIPGKWEVTFENTEVTDGSIFSDAYIGNSKLFGIDTIYSSDDNGYIAPKEPRDDDLSSVILGSSNGGEVKINNNGTTIYSTPKKGQIWTVTFNTDGGSAAPANQTISDGAKVVKPATDPTKSCYTFSGWYNGNTEYDFNSAVTSELTLTAKWKDYSCGGGSSSSSSSSSSNKTGTNNTGTNNTGTVNTGTVETGTVNTGTENEETVSPVDPQAVQENGFTKEFNDAYEFAFANGITTMKSIKEAAMEEGLTRIAMAKMLSQYAINVLKKTPDTSKECKFGDVSAELDAQYDHGVTLACQLGIMGVGITDFRPNDPVVRAEFGTALSRLLFGIEDGVEAYYTTHLAKLKEAGIISNDDPTLEELRGYVMLMLMRSAK